MHTCEWYFKWFFSLNLFFTFWAAKRSFLRNYIMYFGSVYLQLFFWCKSILTRITLNIVTQTFANYFMVSKMTLEFKIFITKSTTKRTIHFHSVLVEFYCYGFIDCFLYQKVKYIQTVLSLQYYFTRKERTILFNNKRKLYLDSH